MRMTSIAVALLLSQCFVLTTEAQEEDAVQGQISVTHLTGHLYKLESNYVFSVNLMVSAGPDGLLLVDAGRSQTTEQLRAALDTLADGPVKYVVSTHSHGDHTGGNPAFGPEVILIAHENTARRMSGRYFALPPMTNLRAADISVAGDFSIQFNGEEIRFIHVPRAHTDGDLMAYFTGSRVLYAADLLFADLIPFVDLDLGGDVRNFADNLKRLCDTLPGDVIVVPGHGRNYSLDDVKAYCRMLEYTIALAQRALDEGTTAEAVLKDEHLAQWASWSHTFETTRMEYWIPCIFRSLQASDLSVPLSICEPLTRTLIADGATAAVEQYRRLKQTEPRRYNFGEGELNNLGYHLMWRQMMPEAQAIFDLTIQEYPESANAYDSMGEFYMTSGQNDLAVQFYEKSLAMDSTNANAVEMLRQLKGER